MIVKVCGITQREQYNWLASRGVDMIGLNFYPPSKRYLPHPFPFKKSSATQNVGVFVNPTKEEVTEAIEEFALDMIQLHGDESSTFCRQIAAHKPVIKAFGIEDNFDFATLKPYLDTATYFLFDTKTAAYGGSGRKFNWQKLNEYTLSKPFLLSGGISLKDVPELLKIKHHAFAGIDVNSGFETAPGIKNLNEIDNMLKLLEK